MWSSVQAAAGGLHLLHTCRPPSWTQRGAGAVLTSPRFLCTLQYRSPWGEVRIGRILEDLDSLSALIAFDHWSVKGGSEVLARDPPGVATAFPACARHRLNWCQAAHGR